MHRIFPLTESHLTDADRLVGERCRLLRNQVPHIPSQYTESGTFLPMLQNILKRTGSGVAALRGGRLVGFLTGWRMESFRGKRSIYSPEWANAAVLEDSTRIYEEMYASLAGEWLADGYIAHYISLFPNDVHALRAWNGLGFGMVAVDGLRSLDPAGNMDATVNIRRAGPGDLELVIKLEQDLRDYMQAAPIFLLPDKKDLAFFESWLNDPGKPVWLAYSNDEPVAFMRLGPADEDAAAIIVDDRTTSIYAAYTREDARLQGIASALLEHGLQFARSSCYERCAVSFEPMNLLATRFWLRTFQPVSYSLLRILDDRLVERKG